MKYTLITIKYKYSYKNNQEFTKKTRENLLTLACITK
jgi:hypothetical protein